MQSYARSLVLTAALLVAAVVALLITAAPQEKKVVPPPARPPLKIVKSSDGPPSPPITFADPDGQSLVLEELSARTIVHGMLSLTELELRFRNPQDRRIEGRFTCTLPPNAAISRFAKEIDGHLMEGEVVERLRANQVYESFLHQMRDPALLEQDQGNRFSARIFPIDPHAPVRLLVSYTQLLPMRGGVRTYTLPLRGLSKVNKLSFRGFVTALPGEGKSDGKMTTATAEVTSFDENDWTPDKDIVFTWNASDDRGRILRAGDFYLAAFRPAVNTTNLAMTPNHWLFYVDTSASSAEGAPHRIKALEELLDALPPTDRVQLIAFDQDIVPLASGNARELSRSVGNLLRERLFLGGTDISAVLRDVAHKLEEDSSQAVVIASDLVPTVGETASHEVQSAIDALPPRGTVHALILGSREDAATAKAVTKGRGRVIRVPFTESIASLARDAADDLRRPLGASFDIKDAGAEWIYPTHFDDVQPGDEVIALGKLKAGGAPQLNIGNDRGSATTLDASTYGPLLEREAYRTYLDYLAQREASESSDAVRRALATEQVKISVEQRVVIPRTTMLVLESEWDYQRFGLDRRALAAILTIEAGGIGRVDRDRVAWQQVPPPTPKPSLPIPVPMRRRESAVSNDTAKLAEARPAPEAMAPPASGEFDFESKEEVTAVEGGVEGGVPGGVVGGTVSGVASGYLAPSAAVDADAVATADAPRPVMQPQEVPPPPAPPPPPPMRVSRGNVEAQTDAKKDISIPWLQRRKPSKETIADLEKQLKDNPRDREVYNQLSESLIALAAWNDLRDLALRWQPYDPENPQVYEVLGTASEQLGRETEAARAFASLIEVAPAKPELLQRAGLLLLRTKRARLAEAPLRRALELRPDRANAYRHLALLLWRDGRIEEAARVLESATRQEFPGWYGDVQRVIHEELGYVYRAWLKKDESKRREIEARADEYRVDLGRRDALRVTLAWETDANDVDLHVVDPEGEEVFYGNDKSRSGLQLYEDITQGLGPEVVRTGRIEHGTYHIGVKYFAAGPMGISRGVVIVMRGDSVEIYPFRLAEGGEDIRYITAVKM